MTSSLHRRALMVPTVPTVPQRDDDRPHGDQAARAARRRSRRERIQDGVVGVRADDGVTRSADVPRLLALVDAHNRSVRWPTAAVRLHPREDLTPLAELALPDHAGALLVQGPDAPGPRRRRGPARRDRGRRVPDVILDEHLLLSLTAFLRIATHPRVIPRPLTADAAGEQVSAWLSAPSAWVPVPTPWHGEVPLEPVRDLRITGALVSAPTSPRSRWSTASPPEAPTSMSPDSVGSPGSTRCAERGQRRHRHDAPCSRDLLATVTRTPPARRTIVTDGFVSEQALMAHRKTGVVDERLLGVLRTATLVCGVDQAGGTPSPAVREIEGNRVLLAWTSARRAADAGWTGPVVERTGAQVAALLRGTGLGLAINVGHTASVGLDVTGVEHLGGALPGT